mmetsp:Transcript_125902/g.187926  ORF Transcript_125902/g.187926 Transcript_125902/m.187926 type:complete len:462 (-) Transcript_125902:85-1470(-)
MLLVLGVGDEPVDRGEMLALGELLVETPEHLHDTEGGCAHRVGEISAGRRHSTHDGDGASALGVAEALDLASALVEGRQTRRKVRRVPLIGRHLSETTRDLTKGLSPARGGVGHHRHVHAHVTHVLGEGDAGVDGSLSGSHRHVGRVGDQGGTLHDGVHLAVLLHSELGKVHEHLSHLVSALAASDVDDGVGVGVLGERLRDHSLAAAERARHSAGSAEHGREQSVEHTLASEERVVASELLSHGARVTHGPELGHGELLAAAARSLDLDDLLLQVVVAGRGDPLDAARLARVHHDGVVDKLVLLDHAVDVSARDQRANGVVGRGAERPGLLHVQRLHVDTSGDEHGSGLLHDDLQRTLDSVENLVHDTRTQHHRQRLTGTLNRVTNAETGGLLVNLDGGGISLETDDLSDEAEGSDTHKLVHSGSLHLLGNHHGSGNLDDNARLAVGNSCVHPCLFCTKD